MNIKAFVFLFGVFGIVSAGAATLSKDLARSDVSHLELIANNLNLLTILQKNQHKEVSPEGMREQIVTFSVKDKKQLNVAALYSAPVGLVTSSQCNQTVNELSQTVRGEKSQFYKLISVLSPLSLTEIQSQEILKEASLFVSITADENKELRVACKL